MSKRLMGIETEYAIATLDRGAGKWSPAAAGSALLRRACQWLRHLSGPGQYDLFLENGARIYLDAGSHPEFCTPEVDNPSDCVRHVLAGEAILRDLVAELRKAMKATNALALFKCNVDYSRPGVTWGLHESYLHRANPACLPRELISHLVSRIYTGAGGLDPLCPGIRFSLSPRLHLFATRTCECRITGGDVTPERGIYNPRDEPLARGGYHRLHVICGDSVCSQTALWLRVATTCLVVAMAEAGLKPGRGVELRDPVDALKRFVADPCFRATAPLASGRRVTALQIQRHYLEQVEAHLDHRCMPRWAAVASERWRAILDTLDLGPEAVALVLDWATKRHLFIDHLRRRGIAPETLPHWNHVLTRVQNARLKRGQNGRLDADTILKNGSCGREVRHLQPYLRERGLCWDQLRPLLVARDELCEIDTRVGQIAPRGIFDSLEPVLKHRLPGVDRIDEARTTAPRGSRARLRGNYIRKLARGPGGCAYWDSIRDARGRMLDLSDPFARSARWNKPKRRTDQCDRVEAMLCEAYAEYQKGDFEEAYRVLRSAMRSRIRAQLRRRYRFVSYLAWVQSRRGHLRQAIAALDRYAGRDGHDDAVVRDYVVAYRFQGLAPLDPRVWRWIRRGDVLLEQGCWSSMMRADFLGNKGCVLARTGSLPAAADVLRSACEIQEIEPAHPRMRARVMADLANVLRILGDRHEAARWLDEAERIHRRYDFPGERADHLLTCRAKLEGDTERARALLKEAATIQRRLSNHIGLTRTLLLDARLTPTKGTATRRRKEVMALRGRAPDLRSCPRLRHILAQWDEWADGASRDENGDYFWLL